MAATLASYSFNSHHATMHRQSHPLSIPRIITTPPLSPGSPSLSDCSEVATPGTPDGTDFHLKPTEGYFDIRKRPTRQTPSAPSFALPVVGPSGGPTSLQIAASAARMQLRLPFRCAGQMCASSPLSRPSNNVHTKDGTPPFETPSAPRLSCTPVFSPETAGLRPLQHLSVARIRDTERDWPGCGCGCGKGAGEEDGARAIVGLGISFGNGKKRKSMKLELDRVLGERTTRNVGRPLQESKRAR